MFNLLPAMYRINHSTRHLQNVSKCLQISKHALIAPALKSLHLMHTGSVHYPPVLCVWVQVPKCSPSCGAQGAPAVPTPELLPHPAQGSVPPMCTPRSGVPLCHPLLWDTGCVLLGMLGLRPGSAPTRSLFLQGGVTKVTPAPRHLPGVS